jgi:hypothetical protein
MADRPRGAGTRDRVVTIQSTATPVSPGYPRESFSDWRTVRARREDTGGDERFVENKLSAPFRTTWELPYIADMDPERHNVPKTFRLKHETRIHDIVHAEIIGRKRGILVMTLAKQG